MPVTASRLITQTHAQAMVLRQESETKLRRGGLPLLIVELDGTNIPVVETPEKSEKTPVKDRRKERRVGWREARLCFARRPESVSAIYRATLQGVEEVGKYLEDCVAEAGGGRATNLHCVGDAAAWIINQIERRFPEQASYLIDFYHLSEYLSSASELIEGEKKEEWLRRQQEKMKANLVGEVIVVLKEEVENSKEEEGKKGVRACYRYIRNHEQYFDYKGAIEKGLPIGSGEVEGGHRWVIQKRLKISGAWWKEENAEKMLALRVVRANDEWESYWEEVRQAAA